MKYATKENTKLGDIVSVPINNEFMEKEQICQKYEVVLALKSTVNQEKQIVGTGQKPLPDLIEFSDEVAFTNN